MSKYAIIDLEMCRVPDGIRKRSYHAKSEIIQIGAVLLDDGLKVSDTFMTYVSPEFGFIDTYIQKLTGITKSDVKDAPSIHDALKLFLDWLPEDTYIVSWSENDKFQIRKELKQKNIAIERLDPFIESWIDCQQLFGKKMDSSKIYKLSEALIIADIALEDGEHDALVDAKNTALLFTKIKSEQEFTLNRYYTSDDDDTSLTYSPFADLLSKYDQAS